MGCGSSNARDVQAVKKGQITSYDAFYAAIEKGSRLIILDDKVIDIASFAADHSCGSTPLDHFVGMEIGRYMFGGFQMPGGRAHVHDDKAYKLLGSNTVGEIKEDLQAKIFRPLGDVKGKVENETWKIVSKKMLTSCHGVFQFKNPNYQIAGVLPYFDHCGKYYKVVFIKIRSCTQSI